MQARALMRRGIEDRSCIAMQGAYIHCALRILYDSPPGVCVIGVLVLTSQA